MAAVHYLGFVLCLLGTINKEYSVIGDLYHRAKFGWNWQCSFEDMQVKILCEFGLKMPIYAIFGRGFVMKMEAS